jgi:REP element-mobilizing transposase RayT
LDAPDTLHHVRVRGLERRGIFMDDVAREDVVARVAALAAQGAWTVYVWALFPNHAHLLVRTGRRPLPRGMRSLLTAYAGAFNRRHKRIGHLFQHRYTSIVVEEEPYVRELVRYLHLNPIRAKVVPDLRHLARYPWTGHRALLGTVLRTRACGQTRGNISTAARKGAAHARRWQAAIPQWCRGDEAESTESRQIMLRPALQVGHRGGNDRLQEHPRQDPVAGLPQSVADLLFRALPLDLLALPGPSADATPYPLPR